MIERSVEKGSRLANQLLSFSAAETAELQPVNIRGLMTDLEFMVQHATGPDVVLDLRLPSDVAVVKANRDQLELAVLNLAINARDAMNGKGSLRMEARECADTVELLVSDTGPGVAPNRRRSIFVAFETDKPKGTGLGLAQVAGMAKQAGGGAYVTEAEGGGACFVITLPKVVNVVPVQFGASAVNHR